jgi:putative transposase
MRYPDGGGLTAQGRAKREQVRRQAAGWFADGVSVPEVARRLRVSQTAVYGWRKRWKVGGEQALDSKGSSGSRCRLDDARLERLAAALDDGPATHGFGADQRWTLARVSDLIARMFHVRYTLRGTATSCTASAGRCRSFKHRAVERDEQAIVTWRKTDLA